MRIATALDRNPSQYFKKWIEHHTKFFDKKDFVFLNFSKDYTELKRYLINQGFENLNVFEVTETKPGRDSHFGQHLAEMIQQGLNANSPFIIHCPLDKIVHTNYSFYRQFINESNSVINTIKSVIVRNGHLFIFLDSDELLVCENFDSILKENFNFIAPVAYGVVQNTNESKFNWDLPIHEQRDFWKYDELYEKPIIVKKEMSWGNGRHLHHQKREGIRSDIILLHIRDICFEYLFEENERSKVIYPEQPKDHRDVWENKESFDEWVKKVQTNIVPIRSEHKILLRKYNV